VGNRYGYDFVPVTDNGYRFRYVIKIAVTDIQRCYPRIVYPLPCVRLPCGPVTASAAGHTSDGPLLIQPYPPHGARAVAPRMRPHLRGCQRARFRFRWGPHPTPPLAMEAHIFRASSCALLSPSQIAEQSRAATTHRTGKGGNGDSGSPLWPARAVLRGPVLVLQEGAVHRQGQLQPPSQGPCSSPTRSCFVTDLQQNTTD
jgi:hypothetical protein